MRRRSLLMGAVGLAGCSLVPQAPYVQRRDWPLEVRRPTTTAANPRGGVLLVRNMRAAPGLEERGLQWIQRDGSVHVDFYEQWAVPPAQGVEDALRRWLADAGLFKAVVTPGSMLNADYVLEGELTTFAADLRAGKARAAVSLVLLDQRQAAKKVLLQRTEAAEHGLDTEDAPAIAAGLSAALVEVLQRTETDVAAAVRR
jgi:ABC-type uncharacterized transport system auxiliary subunit